MTLPSPDITTDAVAGALRELSVVAPGGLVLDTLIAVGLGDGYAPIATPIGSMWVAWNGLGVSLISGVMDAAAFESEFIEAFHRPLGRVDELPDRLARVIERRLAGDRRARVPVDLRGRTSFERAVLDKTVQIPRGEVRPYGWIAAEIGHPAAVRAVGTALAKNPIPLVIPCHRVVRTDGHIGRYSLGGPENKRALLTWEGADPDRLEELASGGIRYVGSDTTRIVCHLTCRHARRIAIRHRVPFRSLGDAAARGYRACRDCRPVRVA